MSERIITAEERNEDKEFEWSLRPKRLAEFIGQEGVKANLEILISAARGRNEPIEHILIAGPPGLGKTTLANIMANEMGVNIRTTSGPAIEHQGALASILTNLEDRDIFFVDEIHRLARPVEESLYPAMEDFKFDFVSGKGAGAQTFRLQLPRFTVIGATTRQGMLSAPLRDRFGAVYPLYFYGAEELFAIVIRSARLLKVSIDDAGAHIIAAALAAHRESRTVCCGVSGTSPRCGRRGASTRKSRWTRCRCWRSTNWASTSSTAGSCAPSSRSTRGDRLASTPSPCPCLRIPRPLRMSTSRS